MKSMTISEIALAVKGKIICGDADLKINSVFIDSRKPERNGLFVPIVGENFDAHDFISQAFENGAVASLCMVGKNLPEMNNQDVVIEVKDTVEALQNLAKYYRKKFQIPVIGITGSVGKTSTKEMIFIVLSQKFNVHKTQGNFNGQIGLPISIFNLSDEHEAAIFEMGVSEIGEMEKLCEIANPDFAVLTNIGVSHIEKFKKLETTCDEKMKILNKPEGVYFLNGDDQYLSNSHEKSQQKCIYFGLNEGNEFRAKNISQAGNTTHFTLVTENVKESIKIPCLGTHNVYNALAAVAISLRLGLNFNEIKTGILCYKTAAMRQQIVDLNGVTLIDDSYNASPDSVKAAINVLKSISSSGKNIAVLADILELGEESEQIHFELGEHVGRKNVDVLITVGEKSEFLGKGAKSVNQNLELFHFKNNKDATEKLKQLTKKGDKILVKGSRGMKTEEIVEALKQIFSNF